MDEWGNSGSKDEQVLDEDKDQYQSAQKSTAAPSSNSHIDEVQSITHTEEAGAPPSVAAAAPPNGADLWCSDHGGWTIISVLNLGQVRNEDKPYKNGKCKKGVNAKMRHLIVNFPGHITVFQEYDENFMHKKDLDKFHIIAPREEGFEHGVAILARRYNDKNNKPCIQDAFLLESACITKKPASPKKVESWTPMMVARLDLPHGKSVRILNMHFSYHQAKKETGYKEAYKQVINKMVELIYRHGVHLLIGDFNGAAKDIADILEEKGITATMDDDLKELVRAAEAKGEGQPLRIFQIGAINPCKKINVDFDRPDFSAHPPLIRGFGGRKSSDERKARRHQEKINRNLAITARIQNQRTYKKRRLPLHETALI